MAQVEVALRRGAAASAIVEADEVAKRRRPPMIRHCHHRRRHLLAAARGRASVARPSPGRPVPIPTPSRRPSSTVSRQCGGEESYSDAILAQAHSMRFPPP